MIFLWVLETKQRTLEELDYVFAVPTAKHMKYQTTKAFPWFIQRHVFRNKNSRLEPLCKFDEHLASDQARAVSVSAGVRNWSVSHQGKKI